MESASNGMALVWCGVVSCRCVLDRWLCFVFCVCVVEVTPRRNALSPLQLLLQIVENRNTVENLVLDVSYPDVTSKDRRIEF